ncbi:MAG: fatty acid desaturase [Acidobacteriota bacterium]|nr:fatty acid desaturase [Acidobacteriota bacterium]
MTHAEARHALSAGLEEQIAGLRRQRPARRIAEIAFFVTLWSIGITLGLTGWRLTGIAASAAALNAFFLLSHEGHHNLLFRNRFINHATNVILCIPLLHSAWAYRVLHDLHHKFLGSSGDPDDLTNYTSRATTRWALQFVRLTIGTLVYMPMIPIVAWRRADRANRIRIAIEYALVAAVLFPVFMFVPIRTLLQVWLIPGVIVGYISAIRALAQHALTDTADPLLASRSVRSNGVVAFLLLNENYHLEHHLFPEVPSYNLPRLQVLLRSRLPRKIAARSYTRFMAGFLARFLHNDESPMGLVTP